VPRVAIKTGHGPVAVEGFPASAKRSCEGALHLHPGHFRDVTADELGHIREGELQVDVLEDAATYAAEADQEALAAETEAQEAPETDQPAAGEDAVPKRKRAKKPQAG
jgi:hypothetical protein